MTLSIGLILLISVIVHEVAHGYVADYLGDTTPRAMGRLSLNPLVHMDWLGSVLLPMLMMVSGASVWLGWAKPVPVNPRNFANPSRDMMLVALAGPLSNLGLAGVASIGLKMIPMWASVGDVTPAIVLCQQAVIINAGLMVFNLMPIPPLDGSKIMLHWAAQPVREMLYRIEPYGFALIFMLAYLGVLMPIIRLFMVPVIRMLV
ncbi:site-2 protease family protein [bacterium]|nr:site-2 protease family protein [bacterium]